MRLATVFIHRENKLKLSINSKGKLFEVVLEVFMKDSSEGFQQMVWRELDRYTSSSSNLFEHKQKIILKHFLDSVV